MKINLKKIRKRQKEVLQRTSKAGRAALVSIVVLLCWSQARGQSKQFAFSPGEEISYGAYYNWQFVWVNAGEVTFTADTLTRGGQKQWLLKATGHSLKAYDWLYSVRDTFFTYLSYPDFQPNYFYRSVNHAGAFSRESYLFNHPPGKTAYFHESKSGSPINSTIPYQAGVNDVLTQAFQLRNYKFDRLKDDELVRFKMLTNDKTSELYFRYKGMEPVKTRNGRKFNCHKVAVPLVKGDYFPEGEEMYIWFTADQNHIPIMVETNIRIGTVKAIFLDAKSVTFPLNSEID